jgi:hypothetical protein
MIVAARDADFWIFVGIYAAAGLVVVYFAPRLIGLIVLAPLRALNARRRRPAPEPSVPDQDQASQPRER